MANILHIDNLNINGIGDIATKLTNLEEQLNTLTIGLRNSGEANAELVAQINILNGEIEDLKTEIAELKRENRDLKKELQAITESNNKLSNELDKQKEKNKEIRDLMKTSVSRLRKPGWSSKTKKQEQSDKVIKHGKHTDSKLKQPTNWRHRLKKIAHDVSIQKNLQNDIPSEKSIIDEYEITLSALEQDIIDEKKNMRHY